MPTDELRLADLPDGISVMSVMTIHGRHVYQIFDNGRLVMQFSELKGLADALRRLR